ncbi:metallophosphoesterase family protein [Agarivorans aestuarii]|uniref:metallophosphoesterase family protein n=1 Tax=Agarivorans aestuarii TaxID=1563703 RepID=UPI001C7ED4DF|nr:metallophosphoesterase family protein [Agarivorans aestuarii]
MRLAAISDIHSNVYALDAVLADIRKRGADVVVNLGDILYGPIAPRSTFELLMENDLVTVRGNQDRQIYEASSVEIASNPTMQFILADLGVEPLKWMRNLPFNLQLNEHVFLCHGTPNDDLTYLLENIDSGRAIVRSDNEIVSLLGTIQSDVVICGHTHTPRAVKTSTKQLVVNPGSVGLPAYTDDEPVVHSMESFSHHATYAIVENNKEGWSVQHIKVDYAYDKAAREAKKRNRLDWVHFLTTGRGL